MNQKTGQQISIQQILAAIKFNNQSEEYRIDIRNTEYLIIMDTYSITNDQISFRGITLTVRNAHVYVGVIDQVLRVSVFFYIGYYSD